MYIDYDISFGTKGSKDFASLQSSSIDDNLENYENARPIWKNDEAEEDPTESLMEVLDLHNVKYDKGMLLAILEWSSTTNEVENISSSSDAVKKVLDLIENSKNIPVMIYAIKRLFCFPSAAKVTNAEFAKKVGLSQQAVNKVISKLSDDLKTRSVFQHPISSKKNHQLGAKKGHHGQKS